MKRAQKALWVAMTGFAGIFALMVLSLGYEALQAQTVPEIKMNRPLKVQPHVIHMYHVEQPTTFIVMWDADEHAVYVEQLPLLTIPAEPRLPVPPPPPAIPLPPPPAPAR